MGSFLVVSFSLTLGIVLGAVGIPLAVWVGAALYRADVARNWAVWAMEHSPLPPYAPPPQVASDALQRDSLIAAGLVAALLCLLAFSLLLAARRALRSADESHDGKATIELKGQPLRVGRPVEGCIWLAQGSRQGELYRVELCCQRGHGPAGSQRMETAYSEELEVEPVLTPVGWSLPFSFAVPPIAPPSGVSRFMSGPAYRWRLAFQRSGGWISLPSVFALDLAPATPEELGALEKSGRKEPGLKRAADGITREAAREPLFRERNTVGHLPSTDPLQQPLPPTLEPEPVAMAGTRIELYPGEDVPLHERPEFRTDEARQPGMFTKVVKWLFLVIFGGVLAVSAVALATAMLLRYIF